MGNTSGKLYPYFLPYRKTEDNAAVSLISNGSWRPVRIETASHGQVMEGKFDIDRLLRWMKEWLTR